MEALWDLEDKCKLSTKQAIVLLICAAFGVAVLCTVTMLLRNKSKRKKFLSLQANDQVDKATGRECSDEEMPTCSWISIKRALMGSVRWSKASKWEERKGGSWRETPLPLLEKRVSSEFDLRWPSHNSDSPVWQRPILMGEKCELPRFSGLILYDERGQLRCDADHKETHPCKITTNEVINLLLLL